MILGVVVGYAIGQHRSAIGHKTDEKPVAAQLAAEATDKPAADLAPALPAQPPSGAIAGERRAIVAGAGGIDRLVLLRSLADEGFASMCVSVLEGQRRNTRLSHKFVELFALTPTDETEINDAIRRVQEGSERLQGELAKSRPGADGSWIIEIPAFPEAGGRLFDDVNETFARVLGPQRYEMFQRFYGEYLNNMFGNLGTRDRQITIKRKPQLLAGRPHYELSDRFSEVDGMGNMTSSGADFRDSLEAYLGEFLTRRVPPEFWEK